MTAEPSLDRCLEAVRLADLHARHGRVTNLIGLIVEATGVEAEVGELCQVESGRNNPPVPAEVVGFRDSRTLLMPLGEMHGIGPGNAVTATGEQFRAVVGDQLLGRVVDALGRPLDGVGEPIGGPRRSTTGAPPSPPQPPPIRARTL